MIPQETLVKLLVAALIVGAAFSAGYVRGLRSGMERFNDYVAEQAQAAVQIVRRQGAATERVVTRYMKVKGDTEIVTRIVQQDIVKYVEAHSGGCIDPDWVRLHNAAAVNTVPERAAVTR